MQLLVAAAIIFLIAGVLFHSRAATRFGWVLVVLAILGLLGQNFLGGIRVLGPNGPGAVSSSPTPSGHPLPTPKPAPSPPSFVDADHDGLDDNLELKLAQKHAPVVLMEWDESNYPVSVPWLLARTGLKYKTCGGLDLPLKNPVASNQGLIGPPFVAPVESRGDCLKPFTTTFPAPDVPPTGQTFFLGNVSSDNEIGSLNPHDWVTYFHVYPTLDGGIMIQYWHVFAYNRIWPDNHGGDWDASIMVRLNPDQSLREVIYSRHLDGYPGTPIPANQLTMFRMTHPLVTIDGGSHAAYASPMDWCVNPGTPLNSVHGTIVWTDTPDDPSSLREAHCLSGGGQSAVWLGARRGGTIWQTWSTDVDGLPGYVIQGGQVTHQISANIQSFFSGAASTHGGLVSLGQYNPTQQPEAGLQPGQAYPAPGQEWIEYSGLWGNPGTPSGPRGPVYQGWSNGKYQAWYYLASPRAAPVGIPTRRVVFVHGINKDCRTQPYQRLLGAFPASIEVDVFCYFDDLGNQTYLGCQNPPPLQPDNWSPTTDVMNAQLDPVYGHGDAADPHTCDGTGPLAYSATLLEDQLYHLYYKGDLNRFGHTVPTAVIGNSMGGAITRGWIRVAQARHSPTISKLVDTVLFLQPAQEGALVAWIGAGLASVPEPLALDEPLLALLHIAAQRLNLDYYRAGTQDVVPASAWYESVNASPCPGTASGACPLPPLHYFDFYSDITATLQLDVELGLWHTTVIASPVHLGDFVMQPGDPNPYSVPTSGGSRFLPYGSSAPDRHEYRISQAFDVVVPVSPSALTAEIDIATAPGAAADLFNRATASHFKFEDNIDNLMLDSCAGGRATVVQEVVRVLNTPATACPA